MTKKQPEEVRKPQQTVFISDFDKKEMMCLCINFKGRYKHFVTLRHSRTALTVSAIFSVYAKLSFIFYCTNCIKLN